MVAQPMSFDHSLAHWRVSGQLLRLPLYIIVICSMFFDHYGKGLGVGENFFRSIKKQGRSCYGGKKSFQPLHTLQLQ